MWYEQAHLEISLLVTFEYKLQTSVRKNIL